MCTRNTFLRRHFSSVALPFTQAGRLLADRLYAGGSLQMDYTIVATTVYTPLEYGCAGLSEEEAIEQLGEANIETYHSYFKPLEWAVAGRPDNECYAKVRRQI